MRASRFLPLLLALPLAGALVSAYAGDTPLPTDPRKRLRRVEDALTAVDRAVQLLRQHA